MSQTTVAAALGRGPVIEYKGQVYDLAPLDHVQVISDFELHLRQTALGEVDKVRSLLGPVGGDAAMRAYLDNAGAGAYDFASPYWLECSRYPKHQQALLWASLRVGDRTVSRQLAKQLYLECASQVERLFFGDPADTQPGDEAADGLDSGNVSPAADSQRPLAAV